MFSPTDFLEYQREQGEDPKINPPKGVIICYDRKLLDLIKTDGIKGTRGFSGEFFLLGETDEQVGVIGNFGFGAPTVVTIMEGLIAFGVKNFLSIGIAGSLQSRLTVGSIVVCNRAIRDEGTSHHYLKPSKFAYASKRIVNKIEKELKRSGLDYAVGSSWTIDAPFRETIAEVRKYREEGVLTVEMEASAIFSLAKYRNVEAGAIFTISDCLAELEWKPKFHLTLECLRMIFGVAKEVLASKV